MTFSNPAADAKASAAAYVRALLEVLGDRRPLDVLPELVSWIETRVREVDPRALARPEGPGKWSVIEVVQHLADSELVLGFRARMILSEDRPPLQGYDQDRWATVFRYADVPLDRALEHLRVLRDANLAVLSRLGPAELAREGMHSERGPESLGHLLKLMAAHDLVHRRQIDRILGAAGA
ncbi:MAG TPA: DinB family protein [Gemmatimonadales bacterium]|nr:DinB family protein [Gemmatimonadales bacterium]